MKSAYRRQTPPPDYELTCVEQGSPMGELMRRYWQPVCALGRAPRSAKEGKTTLRGASGLS